MMYIEKKNKIKKHLMEIYKAIIINNTQLCIITEDRDAIIIVDEENNFIFAKKENNYIYWEDFIEDWNCDTNITDAIDWGEEIEITVERK